MDILSQKREIMVTANLRVNEHTTQRVERPAIKTYAPRPDEVIRPRPVTVSRAKPLDVDPVLARSLPRLVTE